MRQRPRNPDPADSQPQRRHTITRWIDTATLTALNAMITAVILSAAGRHP